MQTTTPASGKKGIFQQYAEELANPIALVLKAAEGVKVNVFDSLLAITQLSKTELASFIDTTPKTIDNYRARKRRLKRTESEQLLHILALYQKGAEVFGSTPAFGQWLKEPSYGLGGRKPYDLMYTTGGIHLVMEELIRIEFGALA